MISTERIIARVRSLLQTAIESQDSEAIVRLGGLLLLLKTDHNTELMKERIELQREIITLKKEINALKNLTILRKVA